MMFNDISSNLGPNLHGLIGRKTGSVQDFDYTEMNKNKGKFYSIINILQHSVYILNHFCTLDSPHHFPN